MNLFAKRENHQAHPTNHQAHPVEGHREPLEHVRDEMGLLDLGAHPHRDHLSRHDLSAKPEAPSPYDPGHVHHEVL